MPEITVASTTDAQTAINAAAGVVDDEAKVETPEGEEAEEKQESKPEKQDTGGDDWQLKRIKKLSAEKNEQKKELEALKQRLLAVEQGGKPQPKAEEQPKAEAKTEATPKPTVDQFQTYEEFTEALADWKLDQKLQKIEAQKQEQAQKDAQAAANKTAVEKWNEQIEDAKERYDDFEDVVGRSSLIPNEVAVAITRMRNGADVAYFLGKHPETCKKLMKMGNEGDLLSAIAEVGGISRELLPTEEDEETGEQVPKVTTKAKVPVRPVAGSSTRSTIPLDELPYADYRKLRDKQEKERYRR